MNDRLLSFIQENSPDGGFLQSADWRKFQESVGRKTHKISESDESGELIAYANIITHTLPIVGEYLYLPRGPVIEAKSEKRKAKNFNIKLKIFLNDLIDLARKENIGWIRFEPSRERDLEIIRNIVEIYGNKVVESSVDMQPREILVLDISKSNEEILAGMKQKTRYNIKLSQKRGVSVKVISNFQFPISKEYIEDFLRLTKITAERDRIAVHPENYYLKMLEVIPPEILKLYVAEYKGKVIAANLILFFRKTATYMHGASSNEHRDVMAPYLLQWRAIQDAKKVGCKRYDFGGVKSYNKKHEICNKSWEGITRFKTGFSPSMEPIQFPGSYDIILKSGKYKFYRLLQKAKKIF